MKSARLWKDAQKYIPGGVNSPVRAFKGVGGEPFFVEKGKGSKIYDVDGNEYIDYVCSWGPLILGHAFPDVVKAVKESAARGTTFGIPTPQEIDLAKMIIKAVPSIELVRLVSSGTEAAMSAIRLARGFTKRDKILKFEGCYHGHADSLLVKAGSGAATLGIPDSLGVPEDIARNTITVPYNSINRVRTVLESEGKNIACIIIEPIAGNMGVIPPVPGFLQELRRLTDEHGILLIFDEVITGFRVGLGGAQELYGIKPDLTVLGKIIGGGLPVGAFGGRREIMENLAPLGGVYQAGTLSGNPIAISAGIATLKTLFKKEIYKNLEKKSKFLCDGLKDVARMAGVSTYHTRVGSLFCMFFTDKEVVDYESAKTSDTKKYAAYFHGMLRHGIYFAPSQFEAAFMSATHTAKDIEKTIKAACEVIRKI
jgi:glutamate-1-semialdehyde 2,1-aminomutase